MDTGATQTQVLVTNLAQNEPEHKTSNQERPWSLDICLLADMQREGLSHTSHAVTTTQLQLYWYYNPAITDLSFITSTLHFKIAHNYFPIIFYNLFYRLRYDIVILLDSISRHERGIVFVWASERFTFTNVRFSHTHTHTTRHQRNRCLFYYCKYNRWSAKHWLVINSITVTITCLSFFLTGTQQMRASKGQWNLRSRRRRKSFSRLSGEATRGNESFSGRHGLNSQHDEMTSSRLRSLFLFDFSINALFERCSTTIDPSDHRGTFGQNGKATFNIDLSVTNSNCFSANDN